MAKQYGLFELLKIIKWFVFSGMSFLISAVTIQDPL